MIDTDIPTYQLLRKVTKTRREGTEDLDASLALTTVTSPAFVPITSDKLRLSKNDNFSHTVRTLLGKRERIPLHSMAIASYFAPSTDLSKCQYPILSLHPYCA